MYRIVAKLFKGPMQPFFSFITPFLDLKTQRTTCYYYKKACFFFIYSMKFYLKPRSDVATVYTVHEAPCLSFASIIICRKKGWIGVH
jgi:hypothetical protein